MGSMEGCVFCGIVAGDIPADVVHTSDRVVAFRDIHPLATVHVLVVPRDHYPNAAALAAADVVTTAELVTVAAEMAAAGGCPNDYRLMFNTGAGAGQTVFHAHLHLLAGDMTGHMPGLQA